MGWNSRCASKASLATTWRRRLGVQLIIPDDDPAPLEAMRQGYGRLLGLGGGLDIRV